MTQILPRWNRAMDAMSAERAVAKAVLESGPADVPSTVTRATLGGDTRRMRGIPCIARGVSGVSPGTDPRLAVMYVRR